MKKSSIIILQAVVIFFGIGVLFFMLWEPHFEGRNVDSTFFEVYFKDPFLAYAYTASIAFFTALYQAFKLLGNVGKNNVFSLDSVKAFRTIRYCATIIIGFVLGAEVWLGVFQRGKDDIAGGVFMGLLLIAFSGVVAIAAKMFEGIVQNTLENKSN